MRQHAFAVTVEPDGAAPQVERLNQLLNQGWRVVRVDPLSVGGASTVSRLAWFVVVEIDP